MCSNLQRLACACADRAIFQSHSRSGAPCRQRRLLWALTNSVGEALQLLEIGARIAHTSSSRRHADRDGIGAEGQRLYDILRGGGGGCKTVSTEYHRASATAGLSPERVQADGSAAHLNELFFFWLRLR